MNISVFKGRLRNGFYHVGLITQWNKYIGDSICVHYGFDVHKRDISDSIEICKLNEMQMATTDGILYIDKDPIIKKDLIDPQTGLPTSRFFMYWYYCYPKYDIWNSNCETFISYIAQSKSFDYVYNGRLQKL